jgi:predicted GNAT family acetyltransferase
MNTATDLRFATNAEQSRYEAWKGNALAAYVEYSQLANGILISHTEVMPDFEGQGIGSAIARHVLDDARAQAQEVIPACQFMASYIRRHPEYLDLVSEASRRAFNI